MEEIFFKVTSDKYTSKFGENFPKVSLNYAIGVKTVPIIGAIFAYESITRRMGEFDRHTRLLVVKGVRTEIPSHLFFEERHTKYCLVLDYMLVRNMQYLKAFWSPRKHRTAVWKDRCDSKLFDRWNTVFLSECTPIKEITNSYREYVNVIENTQFQDYSAILYDWQTETWAANPDVKE